MYLSGGGHLGHEVLGAEDGQAPLFGVGAGLALVQEDRPALSLGGDDHRGRLADLTGCALGVVARSARRPDALDLLEAIEANVGVPVLIDRFNDAKVAGVLLRQADGEDFIAVNADHLPVPQRFTLAESDGCNQRVSQVPPAPPHRRRGTDSSTESNTETRSNGDPRPTLPLRAGLSLDLTPPTSGA